MKTKRNRLSLFRHRLNSNPIARFVSVAMAIIVWLAIVVVIGAITNGLCFLGLLMVFFAAMLWEAVNGELSW